MDLNDTGVKKGQDNGERKKKLQNGEMRVPECFISRLIVNEESISPSPVNRLIPFHVILSAWQA